ncbi:MAG TPA: glycosyltransferase family A protein [Acidimicrobiales bacterium]|nr:glycosyltransferase family A protein [Acidimicrobiales bacterium]
MTATQDFVGPPPGDVPAHAATAAPPTFSVNIPVYQGADTVGQAIESVLEQTRAPLEIIVCDDGSTDDLATALAPYREHITVLHQENKGVAAARNRCLRHSSGEFVIVCDADDAMMPRAIEVLLELATARPDLDILCRTSYFARDEKLVALSRTPAQPRFPVDDQRMAILRDNFVPAHAAVRRTRLLAVGGYDETIRAAVDYEMWVRLIFSGARAGLLLEPLHIYRQRPGSVSTNDAWRSEGCIAAMEHVVHRDDVSGPERAMAQSRLRHFRAEQLRAQAKEALVGGSPEARRRCLRVVSGRGQSLRQRVKATAAALAPRRAARRAAR